MKQKKKPLGLRASLVLWAKESIKHHKKQIKIMEGWDSGLYSICRREGAIGELEILLKKLSGETK